VQCSKGQCARAFHVPCGKEAGFYFKRIQETRDVCDVAVQMYCALHDPVNMISHMFILPYIYIQLAC